MCLGTNRITQTPATLLVKPTSWATVASKNASPIRITERAIATLKPPPPNKVVNQFKPAQLIIYAPAGKSPFKGRSPKEVTDAVNRALASIEASLEGNPIQVRGASVLPSGDIKLFMASQHDKAWLLHNKHWWSTLAHPDFVTAQTQFPVLIHSVPANADPESDSFLANFVTENGIPRDKLTSTRWLVRPDTEAAHGSIVMNFTNKQVANLVEKGHVFIENSVSHGDEYDKMPTQCFNCQELGHVAHRCRNGPVCALCAEGHNS
ncbi:hypothetical protein CROQUDRAFT_680861 [Cronartium quercuum f. sp. fusiforme G11]|uniref:CCHC-type domain-containing protein n=1 Tax=Cronartium quercuum f. sp. fusiforme G11 TaxID=708437 RepID=A0A9P6NNE8_9BASI|nr:hypothetical protein CROQUDRAFT_680861 [Cronartium quercuum f. sp. fusiforme G11]